MGINLKNMKRYDYAKTANGKMFPMPSKFIIHIDVSGETYKRKSVDVFNLVEEMKLKPAHFQRLERV